MITKDDIDNVYVDAETAAAVSSSKKVGKLVYSADCALSEKMSAVQLIGLYQRKVLQGKQFASCVNPTCIHRRRMIHKNHLINTDFGQEAAELTRMDSMGNEDRLF